MLPSIAKSGFVRIDGLQIPTPPENQSLWSRGDMDRFVNLSIQTALQNPFIPQSYRNLVWPFLIVSSIILTNAYISLPPPYFALASASVLIGITTFLKSGFRAHHDAHKVMRKNYINAYGAPKGAGHCSDGKIKTHFDVLIDQAWEIRQQLCGFSNMALNPNPTQEAYATLKSRLATIISEMRTYYGQSPEKRLKDNYWIIFFGGARFLFLDAKITLHYLTKTVVEMATAIQVFSDFYDALPEEPSFSQANMRDHFVTHVRVSRYDDGKQPDHCEAHNRNEQKRMKNKP